MSTHAERFYKRMLSFAISLLFLAGFSANCSSASSSCDISLDCSLSTIILLFSRTPVPGFVYLATSAGISRVTMDHETGAVSNVQSMNTSIASAWLLNHPSENYIYESTEEITHRLRVYRRDTFTGNIEEIYSETGANSISNGRGFLLISPDKKYLLSLDDSDINVYSLSNPRAPKKISTVPINSFLVGPTIFDMSFDDQSKFLFVSDSTSPTSVLSFDNGSFELKSVNGTNGGPRTVNTYFANDIVFRSDTTDGNLYLTTLDRETGLLTNRVQAILSAEITSMQVSKDASRLFTIDAAYNFITYRIDPNSMSTMSPIQSVPFTNGGGDPRVLKQSNNGDFAVFYENTTPQWLYVADVRNKSVVAGSPFPTGTTIESCILVDKKIY